MNRTVIAGCALALLCGGACSATSSSSKPTNDGADDASATDDNASSTRDAGTKKGKDAGVPLGCSGDCELTRAVATFGSQSAVLDQAYFGVDVAGTLRVEVHGGKTTGCPTGSSTYDWSLVITGLEPSLLVSNKATALTATLFDYKGNLIDTPAEEASDAALTPTVVDAHSPRTFVEGDVTATFGGGEIAGHVYATHCDSLDET